MHINNKIKLTFYFLSISVLLIGSIKTQAAFAEANSLENIDIKKIGNAALAGIKDAFSIPNLRIHALVAAVRLCFGKSSFEEIAQAGITSMFCSAMALSVYHYSPEFWLKKFNHNEDLCEFGFSTLGGAFSTPKTVVCLFGLSAFLANQVPRSAAT